MNRVRILLARDEKHNILAALGDRPDLDVELHIADTDLEEAEGELTYLQLPNGTDLVVHHWTTKVEPDKETVDAFVDRTEVRERAEEVVERLAQAVGGAKRRPVYAGNPAGIPLPPETLVLEAGKCQFCGRPATVVLGGVSTCEECDSPPEA